MDMSWYFLCVGLILNNHIVDISWVQFPCQMWKTKLCRECPGAPALMFSSFHLLWCFLSFRYSVCVMDISTGDRHLTAIFSLHFDQLWISVMVSVCCKKKHVWCRVRAILPSCYFCLDVCTFIFLPFQYQVSITLLVLDFLYQILLSEQLLISVISVPHHSFSLVRQILWWACWIIFGKYKLDPAHTLSLWF